jgi:hypothetical protein
MELFLMLVCALRDLAELGELPGDREQNDETLIGVARSLGLMVLALCEEQRRDVLFDCAARLRETALEHDLPDLLELAERAGGGEDTVTWREFQLAQVAADQVCHPGCQDLTPQEQMRRFTARLASIAGRLGDSFFTITRSETWKARADLLLLTLSFITAAGCELPNTPMPRDGDDFDAALRGETSLDLPG